MWLDLDMCNIVFLHVAMLLIFSTMMISIVNCCVVNVISYKALLEWKIVKCEVEPEYS